MPSTAVNKELLDERRKCSFNQEEFTLWWIGGQEKLDEKRAREHLYLNSPEFHDKVPSHFLSHKELYEESVRRATLIFTKVRQLLKTQGITLDANNYMLYLDSLLGTGLMKDESPLRIHFSMFIPAILGHASPEQHQKWFKRAINCEMIGTYAQTELGHGTFLRGLETTATFDESTDEIVLNSPSLTAYKWWPGSLAQTANHCIVMAQLFSKGKRCGIQPFMVQIRDEETHMPLPGLEIGDIGDKVGFKAVNNGFLGFKNYRIPRENMLMKNAKLKRDGTFVKPASVVLTYGTMVYVRVMIVRGMAQLLARAVTVATRYSCVRRQSLINPGQPEVQVIDHLTQQDKLLPLIAKAVALKLTAENLWQMYEQMRTEQNDGKSDRLPELHAIACGLKVISSSDAASGVEVCRLACGGHGYLTCTNFLNMYSAATAACTYEGENTVLLLQTARFLIKTWNQARSGSPLTPTVQYLKDYANSTTKQYPWSDSLLAILGAFGAVAANKLRLASDKIEQHKKSGRTTEEATNLTGLELIRVAEVHSRGFILQSTYAAIERTCEKASPAMAAVLRELCRLVVYHEALKISGDLLRFTTMCDSDLVRLQQMYEDSLAAIRPNAVGIVDAFDYPDFVLGSALGAYDGNVYERLLEEAMKSPLNQEPVNKSFELYLKPLMKRGKL